GILQDLLERGAVAAVFAFVEKIYKRPDLSVVGEEARLIAIAFLKELLGHALDKLGELDEPAGVEGVTEHLEPRAVGEAVEGDGAIGVFDAAFHPGGDAFF